MLTVAVITIAEHTRSLAIGDSQVSALWGVKSDFLPLMVELLMVLIPGLWSVNELLIQSFSTCSPLFSIMMNKCSFNRLITHNIAIKEDCLIGVHGLVDSLDLHLYKGVTLGWVVDS